MAKLTSINTDIEIEVLYVADGKLFRANTKAKIANKYL